MRKKMKSNAATLKEIEEVFRKLTRGTKKDEKVVLTTEAGYIKLDLDTKWKGKESEFNRYDQLFDLMDEQKVKTVKEVWVSFLKLNDEQWYWVAKFITEQCDYITGVSFHDSNCADKNYSMMLDSLIGKQKMIWLNLNYTKPKLEQISKLGQIYKNVTTFDTFRGFNIGLDDSLLEVLLTGMLNNCQKPLKLTMLILSYSSFGPKSLPLLVEFVKKDRELDSIHLTEVGLKGDYFRQLLDAIADLGSRGVLRILGLNKNCIDDNETFNSFISILNKSTQLKELYFYKTNTLGNRGQEIVQAIKNSPSRNVFKDVVIDKAIEADVRNALKDFNANVKVSGY